MADLNAAQRDRHQRESPREQGPGVELSRVREDKLFKRVVLISLGLHVAFFVLEPYVNLRPALPPIEEQAIDTDLVYDTSMTAPKNTALPSAKKAAEAAVPNVLPQLPKKLNLDPPKPKEDTVPLEESKKTQPQPEKKPLAPTPPSKTKINAANAPDQPKTPLSDLELRKRLAFDMLRQQQKKPADAPQAPTDDKMARLKNELAKESDHAGSPVAGLSGEAADHYTGLLSAAVRRNYSLPEAYNLKNANIQVVLAVEVGEHGELLSVKVAESSTDPAFDNLAMEAVKHSVPLPPPPPEAVGQTILMHFSPKSF